MKVRLNEKKQIIRVKVGKHPLVQKKFMNTYFQKRAEYGYIEPNPNVTWQNAPNLVPKDKDRYRVTIDLRPLNAAKIGETWPLSILKAERANCTGKMFFATIDYCNTYWILPLNKDSRDAQVIIPPQRTFTRTRVFHDLKRGTERF